MRRPERHLRDRIREVLRAARPVEGDRDGVGRRRILVDEQHGPLAVGTLYGVRRHDLAAVRIHDVGLRRMERVSGVDGLRPLLRQQLRREIL